MAVRLAASHSLRVSIDDFEFNTQQFLDYLEPTFSSLFGLLKEASECDTKMHVLFVLSFIIERVGISIRGHADSFMQYLPMLWKESEQHNMLRCAIISTLVQLIRALTTVPEKLYEFLLPVIALSTDLQQDSHVYLLEDGLELWFAVIEYSQEMSIPMLELSANLPPLLDSSSETLRILLYIMQAYVVLAPEQYVSMFGLTIMNQCADMITDMRSEGIILILRLVEVILRAAKQQGVNSIKPMLPFIVESVHKNEEFPLIMSMYLSILSYVILIQPTTLSETLDVVAKVNISKNTMQTDGSSLCSSEEILSKVMDVWVEKMTLVTQPERRKLLSLALTSLLTAQSNIVLNRICGIFLNVAETLNDIMKEDEGGLCLDSLIISPNSSPVLYDDGEYETEHDKRKKKLVHSDPIHTIILKDFLKSQIIALQSQVGSSAFDNLMDTVDCETMAMVREHVIL